QPLGEAVHRLAPAPERVLRMLLALGHAGHRPLECVRVQVGDAGHDPLVDAPAVAGLLDSAVEVELELGAVVPAVRVPDPGVGDRRHGTDSRPPGRKWRARAAYNGRPRERAAPLELPDDRHARAGATLGRP